MSDPLVQVAERVHAVAERLDTQVRGNERPLGAAGTQFPPSPRVGRRFFRIDRLTEYVWDGARWLTTHDDTHGFGFARVLQEIKATDDLGNGVIVGQSPIDQRARARWIYLGIRTFVGSPNDTTNYWSVVVQATGVVANRATLASITTEPDPVNTTRMRVSERDPANTNALVVPMNVPSESAWGDHVIQIRVIKTGTPGNLAVAVDVKYRLIG